MPITYSIERSRNLVVEVWTGRVSARAVRAYWRRYFADPQVHAIRRSLADLRGCSGTSMTGPELAALVDEASRGIPVDQRWTIAIVVATPEQYGVARQFQAFAHRSATCAIFYACEEALRWLRDQESRQASRRPAEDAAEPPPRRLGAASGQ